MFTTGLLSCRAVLPVARRRDSADRGHAVAMVGDAAPYGTVTEAFAWLATAMAVAAADAGVVVDRAGPAAAGALAVVTRVGRSRAIGASSSRGRAPRRRKTGSAQPTIGHGRSQPASARCSRAHPLRNGRWDTVVLDEWSGQVSQRECPVSARWDEEVLPLGGGDESLEAVVAVRAL